VTGDNAQGVVKVIDEDSKQLAAALIDGTKIVIPTMQKFPFVLRGRFYRKPSLNPSPPWKNPGFALVNWDFC
jgi:type I restriction enzyme R subunit